LLRLDEEKYRDEYFIGTIDDDDLCMKAVMGVING